MQNPIHEAIKVVKTVEGMPPYAELVRSPLGHLTFWYLDDNLKGFEEKKRWLRARLGLVNANPDVDPGMKDLMTPENLENILVYEDKDFISKYQGDWRVRCDLKREASIFFFRYWTHPDLSGKNTMIVALKKFAKEFKPDLIFELGINYQIEVDWDKAIKLSPYPVKDFA